MSKKILGIGLAVVGAALMFTGIGAPLGTIALGAGLGSISVATIVGLGLEVAGSLLMGPSIPKGLSNASTTGRLTATFVTTEPRKIVFGDTALGNDVRYQAYTGSNQEYLDLIIVHASHEVHSIDELWLDNELAWSATGGVTSTYSGYLTVTPVLVGTSSNGIAIDGTWTASCTLTGCAYSHMRCKLTGNSSSAQSPFASGVTSRTTWRGKGAKVYDPRLDSTVAGGSGSQRATDQTTWAWDNNGSRNPALVELFYELGWKINGKLAVGKGVPPARIDLASYAVGANLCDESITLAAGGTEPRYRADGLISEGDDTGSVRDNLCATMNAMLRDCSGKLSLTVVHNDLGSLVTPYGKASFDDDDVLGQIQWDQTPDLSSAFNVVRGQMIDASNTGLYQPIDFPEVRLTSPDGIDRIQTVTFPFVQSNGQAQRLAKQRAQRNQYQGRLTFGGKPIFWGLNLGDAWPFSHSAFGWTSKAFRLGGQTVSRRGQSQIVAIEENAAIYAWDAEEAPAVVPGVPTVYDALNHPLIVGIDEAGSSIVGPSAADILYDYTGTSFQSADDLIYSVESASGVVSSNVTMSYTVLSGTFNGKSFSDGPQALTLSAGVADITPTSLGTSTATLQINATYNGAALPAFTTTLTKHLANQPTTGTGGAGGSSSDVTSQTSGFTSINTSSFTTITQTLTFTVPAGHSTIQCVINLNDKYPAAANQDGPWHAECQVLRGGVVQGSAIGSSPDAIINYDGELNKNISSSGTMQRTVNMTGLTAGTQYSITVQARVASGALPTNANMVFNGSVALSSSS